MPRASIRDALRLRAAALQVLSGRSDSPSLQSSSVCTWDVFLRTERCALALKSRLVMAVSGGPNVLEAAAMRELQRILSARGPLLRIGHLALQHHIPAIVLKRGGAAVTSATTVD